MKNLLLTCVLSFVSCFPSFAQESCLPTDKVPAFLFERYGELRRGQGVTQDLSGIVDLFYNPYTGSFTITLTKANGKTCMVLDGYAWEDLEDLPPILGEEG